jgi:hypothetical protein
MYKAVSQNSCSIYGRHSILVAEYIAVHQISPLHITAASQIQYLLSGYFANKETVEQEYTHE